MNKLGILVPIILVVVAIPLLWAALVAADDDEEETLKATRATSQAFITAVPDPGEVVVDEAGNTRIRGRVIEQTIVSDNNLWDAGLFTATVNADLDPAGNGPDFGSFLILVDNGPGLQGTWQGNFVGTFREGLPFSFEAIAHGAGDFEGKINVVMGTRETVGGTVNNEHILIVPVTEDDDDDEDNGDD